MIIKGGQIPFSFSSVSTWYYFIQSIFLFTQLFAMLFTASVVTLAIAFSGVVASPVDAGQPASADIIVEFNLSIDTKYNAPNAPWEQDSHPGWYYGNGKPEIQSNKYPCLTSGSVRTFGVALWLATGLISPFSSHISKVAGTWKVTQINSSALPRTPSMDTPRPSVALLALLRLMITWPMVWSTLSMVSQYFFLHWYIYDPFIDCKAMCESVEGCKFVNSKLSELIRFIKCSFSWCTVLFSSLLRCQWQGLFQNFSFIFIFIDVYSLSHLVGW